MSYVSHSYLPTQANLSLNTESIQTSDRIFRDRNEGDFLIDEIFPCKVIVPILLNGLSLKYFRNSLGHTYLTFMFDLHRLLRELAAFSFHW